MGSNTKSRTVATAIIFGALGVVLGVGMMSYAMYSSLQARVGCPPIESAGRAMLAVGGLIVTVGSALAAMNHVVDKIGPKP